MTSQQGGQPSRRDGAWQAVFGDVNDPTDPRFAEGYQLPRQPRRRWAWRLRNTLIALVIVAVIGGGLVAFISRGNTKSPDAGLPVSAGITPTASAGSSAPPPPNSASTQAIKLAEALTVPTTWAQLAPFLTNLNTAGEPTTCLNVTSTNESACKFGAKSAAHHAVLIGDAAALDWMPAIVAELAPHGWDVQVLTEVNCPISKVAITINDVVDANCAAHQSFIASQLASIKPTLIFASDSESDLAYATAPAKPKGKPREKPEDAFTSGLTSAVEAYNDYGKVVVIGSPPGSKPISGCRTSTALPKSCVAAVRSAWTDYQHLEATAVSGHADVINPVSAFCYQGKQCPAIVGVVPVYTDGVRMTVAFAKTLGYLFAPYVGQ